MGIFDFFKKRPNKGDSPNELETLLKEAARDPAARTEFYMKLNLSELFVITHNTEFREGVHKTEKDTKMSLASFADGKIPVFTSINRIFDKGVITGKVHYVGFKSVDLFNITKGKTLILNPYSAYGKELLPEEIQEILDGTIYRGFTREITLEKDTRFLIGQPANYPTEIANALGNLFVNEPEVQAAYLALMKFQDSDEPAHYVIGIDTTGDKKAITDKAGKLVQQFLKSGEFVDFLDPESGSGSFKSIAPFYWKKTD